MLNLVATADQSAGLEGDGGWQNVSSKVQAAAAYYGVSDLTTQFPQDTVQVIVKFFRGTEQEKPELYRKASPIFYVSKDDPPLLLVHGENDDGVPFDQSVRMAETYRRIGVPVEFIVVKNAGHDFQHIGNAPISPSVETIHHRTVDFFKRYLVSVPSTRAERRNETPSNGGTLCGMRLALRRRFVYHQSMKVEDQVDDAASAIAAAIGEPTRARMLYCLVDGIARTSTELAVVADITPSTASVHLQRLKTQGLVKVQAQGKHRYYSLGDANVAAVLEALSVLAGGSRNAFISPTPNRLRAARTCYNHIAGILGVSLHDRFKVLGWLSGGSGSDKAYELTQVGTKALESLGVDVAATRTLRRRFAYACVDWSERRPHVGGAIGAALLNVALKRKWVVRDLDSRALTITGIGRREMAARFGLHY